MKTLSEIDASIRECLADNNILGFYGYINFDDVVFLRETLDKQYAQIEEIVKVLGLYGDMDNWGNSGNRKLNRINEADVEVLKSSYVRDGHDYIGYEIGGKRARESLRKLDLLRDTAGLTPT